MFSFWRNIAPFKPIKIYKSRSFQLETPHIFEYANDDLVWGSTTFVGNNNGIAQTFVELPLRSEVEAFNMLKEAYPDSLPESYKIPLVLDVYEPETFYTESDVEIEEQIWHESINPAWTKSEIFFFTLSDIVEIVLLNEFLMKDEQIKLTVSENLLQPIQPPSKIIGMNYASRYWEVTRVSREKYRQGSSPKKPAIRPIHREQIGQKKSCRDEE